MKKLCSILCAVSLLLTAFVIPAGAAESQGGLSEQQNTLLQQLGIADETAERGAGLTRGQAVQMALAAAGAQQQAAKGIFSDVGPDSPYGASVEAAYQMGLVNGYPDGTFRPEAGISYGEMVKILLTLCGYAGYAEMRGGYPAGYLRTARDTWLSDNIGSSDAEQALTVQEGMTLVYNALHIDLMELDTMGAEESSYQIRKGYNLLKRVFQIEVVTGIITANALTSLYDASGAVAGGLAVDGRQVNGDQAWGRYLGYEADVYVDENNTARCVIPAKRNRTVSYMGDDAVKAEAGRVEAYVGDSNTSQRFRLADGAGYFKNGVYAASLGTQMVTPEDLCRPDTRYVLLDHNGDGAYDCVFAEVFEYFQVKSVDTENRWIYDKLKSRTIELQDGDTLAYLDGRTVPLDKLQYNAVVGVRLPDGAALEDERDYGLEFTVIDGVVSGKASASGGEVVWINGREYKVNPACGLRADSLGGQSGSFYLDAGGKLLIYESTDVDGKAEYAYISNMASDSAFGDQCKVRILLPEEGLCEKEISSRASLVMNGETVVVDGKPVKGPKAILSAKGLILDRVVKVRINGEGEIAQVELAEQIPADERGEKNVFNYTAERTYKTRGADVLSDIYRLPKTATVFTVPEDGKDEKVFRVSTLAEVSKGEDFTCELYGIDESYTAEVALIRQADASQAAVGVESALFLVESIGTTLDSEGISTVCVTGMQSGQEKTLAFRDADAKARDWINTPSTVVPVRRDIRADQLKFGDILQISQSEGVIQSFRVMYLNPEYNDQGEMIRGDGEFARQGSDDSEEIFEWAGLQWPFVNKSMLFVNGKITLKEDDFFSMEINQYKKNMFGGTLQNVYYADADKGRISTISFNDRDFVAGKRAFVTIVWGSERDVVIYQ